jgi:uncharacterized membrane protein YqjE
MKENRSMALENQKSFGEALRDAANNIGEIVRSEFQLVKLEMREAATSALIPLRDTILGAVFSMFALGFLLLAVMFLLSIVLPEWLAALIVFVIAAVIGGALIGKGIYGLRHTNRPIERTAANLKEQVQWAKQQAR